MKNKLIEKAENIAAFMKIENDFKLNQERLNKELFEDEFIKRFTKIIEVCYYPFGGEFKYKVSINMTNDIIKIVYGRYAGCNEKEYFSFEIDYLTLTGPIKNLKKYIRKHNETGFSDYWKLDINYLKDIKNENY